MKTFAVAAVFAAFILPATSAMAAAVGHVTDLQGMVTGTRAGTAAPLKVGDGIDEGDVVKTSDKSRVKIVFDDRTEIVLAEKGDLTINAFVYDPAHPAKDKADISILHTAFSYLGGLLDKTPDPNVSLHMDFGSIGIRGTKIFRAMKNNNECWIYVERGRIDVRNKGGVVHLKSGEGTIMTDQAKAPVPAHIWSAKEIGWIKDQVTDPRLHQKDWK